MNAMTENSNVPRQPQRRRARIHHFSTFRSIYGGNECLYRDRLKKCLKAIGPMPRVRDRPCGLFRIELLGHEAMLLDTRSKLRPRETEQARRLGLVVARASQGVLDHFALRGLQGASAACVRLGMRRAVPGF